MNNLCDTLRHIELFCLPDKTGLTRVSCQINRMITPIIPHPKETRAALPFFIPKNSVSMRNKSVIVQIPCQHKITLISISLLKKSSLRKHL